MPGSQRISLLTRRSPLRAVPRRSHLFGIAVSLLLGTVPVTPLCANVRDCKYPREASRTVLDILNPYAHLWNIGAPHYYANKPEVAKLNARGRIVCFYGGTPRLAELLPAAALWDWRGYRYEADGVCLWNAPDRGNWDADAPPADPYTNAGGHYAGDSMMFYSGSKSGYDAPIPSMRLKAMWRGLQDFQYLRPIEKIGKKSRAELIGLADRLQSGKSGACRGMRSPLYELLSS